MNFNKWGFVVVVLVVCFFVVMFCVGVGFFLVLWVFFVWFVWVFWELFLGFLFCCFFMLLFATLLTYRTK